MRGVRSFYALDSQDFTGALPSLADPRNPAAREYASSILELLSRAPGATPSQRSELVLSFVRSCVRVPLPPAVEMSDEDEEDAMDDGEGSSYLIRFLGTLGPDAPFLLVDALCDPSRERGAAQAWSFARALEGQVEMQGKQVAMREELQKRVLARCLGGECFDLCWSVARLTALQTTPRERRWRVTCVPSSPYRSTRQTTLWSTPSSWHRPTHFSTSLWPMTGALPSSLPSLAPSTPFASLP